jgi:tungstate transport system substrate-binding protein
MKRRIAVLFSWLVLVSMLFGACTTAATTQAPQPTQPPAQPTQKPVEPTQPPAATPTEAPPPTEAAPPLPVPGSGKLTLATTTSTQDSGLLDYLLPMFEKEFGVKVDVIAVGSGQALQLGVDGNADVLLVHSPAAETEYMANGDGTRREDVMYNDFIVICPDSDPAGIKGMPLAVDAFKKIAETQTPFISRGDKSGTNTKELAIWKAAGIEPAGDWYISAGASMGEVLNMAEEKLACTLSDRATYLARTKEGLTLVIMVEGDKILFNPYGVIAVNPAKNPNIQADLATKFIDWIISVPTQELIAGFGKEEFGQSLFNPSSLPWQESQTPAGEVALKLTGKVITEMAWTEAEIKAMTTIDVQAKNKQGETQTYTGVLIADLLKLAGPLPEATKVIFVADDGYTAEIALADLLACTNCIVSFREQGGFNTVLPDQPGALQVKGIVEIKVE